MLIVLLVSFLFKGSLTLLMAEPSSLLLLSSVLKVGEEVDNWEDASTIFWMI
jgi:hypothetical protein